MYEAKDTYTFVIAGGRGSRLGPLTQASAKPMLPFAGKYRLIDYVLSNLYNSGLRKIEVLTQYNAKGLNRYINQFWSNMIGSEGFCLTNSPQETITGKNWYSGTANAIYQNIETIEEENMEHVAIFGADHIYMMDVGHMLIKHHKPGFDLSISALEVPYESAKHFGIFEVDSDGNFLGFEEKPENPKRIPGKDTCLASMGNYIFNKKALLDALYATKDLDKQDFGKHVIPYMIDKNIEKIHVYNFNDNLIKGFTENSRGYWRDVGTIDSYYFSSMELLQPVPPLNLYNNYWSIKSDQGNTAPARTTYGLSGKIGSIANSYVTGGCTISGGALKNSILGPLVYVDDKAQVTESIIFDNVKVLANAQIHKSIIAEGVIIPENFQIGLDDDLDRRRGFIPTISDAPTEIRVVTANMNLAQIMHDIN